MNTRDQWIEANNAFIGSAMAWLRNALLKGNKTRQFEFLEIPTKTVRNKNSKVAHKPALHILSHALGLNAFEAAMLFISAASEFDSEMPALFAKANNNAAKTFPTFGLGLAMLKNSSWDAMSPERPLRHWRLIEISQPGVQALTASAIKADERICNYIKGLNYLDDRVFAVVEAIAREDGALAPSQTAVAESIAQTMQSGLPLPLFQLIGPDSPSKLAVATAAADALGLTIYRITASQIPTGQPDLETFIRLWQRETALLPVALYVDCQTEERGSTAMKQAERLVSHCGGMIFWDLHEAFSDLNVPTEILDVDKPLPAEQAAAWHHGFNYGQPTLAEKLAANFNFNFASIKRIAASASRSTATSKDVETKAWQACLNLSRPALDKLGQAIDVKADWDSLVLPAQEANQLQQVVAQVRGRKRVYDDWGFRNRLNRGLGISVLFAGDSGTGKTMAAEVIAKDLGLLLYRIDLSGVVNKYIGETEKNLRRVFDAAEEGGIILFFDEADALFGARSEVKDAHDRYANIEVNYLLQRIESFSGLAILASNMKKALDQAFLRRLRFIVNFPHPGLAERETMWAKAFPRETPVKDLDFARLSKLNFTGGSIANVALSAAFRAAHDKSPVTMAIVMEAARMEFRKLERPVNEADFRLLESVRVGP
jgi:ATPase family associated with various cellular activities (AAA)